MGGAVILGIVVWVRRRGKSTARLPPQPPATPVLGHLPELIRENKTRTWHLRLNEWLKNQRKVINQLVTNVQKADEIIPLLEYETLKFLHENVTDAKGGLAGARLYQAIGRYTYSAFATAFMGMDIPDTDDAVIPFIMDRVVGERIPVYDDLKSIPYLRMMMKELWRWRPPVALGHPHITARDLQVGEYCLPKGARLHVNAYAISHDPARHEDPERFWPERFKDDETTTMESMNHQDPTKRDHFAFGAGRRGCPGYHVAERSFVITMMRILWAFDIAPAPGTKSKLEFADYAGELPGNPAEDMPVKLTYRSESRKKIVMDVFKRETAARPAMMPLNMGEKRIPKPEEYL
ncbi:Cytochrome P450 monooxygenase yanC [Colletotrichum sp. SAR 10_70]|nr:Cytochrome P450 monooxygenase yanC [Colletotrichum sp. SAR 10_71]KAI8171630.1 Cytochrome P450 monooxygenase yanC [Colletotrichum sp. SAR 10_70]KAI8181936.1 Cytochrome P450 monooxygenase yanC [Colletotrichum sp. SAR 10_75]KAI8247160.1 Cytochrome P450 monooxygenase yanC [Colletotrichum sp. SAR 10_77]